MNAVDKDIPASGVRTMEQYLEASVAPRRFNVMLLVIFAVSALLLATSGIYAVISYSTTERTHEIGIRMALGAQRSDIIRLIVGQGAALAAGGVGVGVIAAFALTRILSGLLYGVSTTDPAIFGLMSLVIMGAALLASYIPARRATNLDPVIALRQE